MSSYRFILSELIEHAFKYNPDEPFTLASGAKSPYYIDCRKVTMMGDVMPHIATVIKNVLMTKTVFHDIQAVGGATFGADPISAAVAYDMGIRMFSVRKEPKKHGTTQWIEGPIEPGMKVLIVEDVITTGASVLHSIRACNYHKLGIVGVVALVDRCEEPYAYIDSLRESLPEQAFVIPIFHLQTLKQAAEEERNLLCPETVNSTLSTS